MLNEIKFTCFPRIHISLIGLNANGYRINGGIGFALEDPKLELTIKSSFEFQFEDRRPKKIDKESIKKIEIAIDKVRKDYGIRESIYVIVQGGALSHHGLGVGTTLTLSCIEGLFIINKLSYNSSDILKYSKRGGTSGIGINTYFKGGFVFDIGRRTTKNNIYFKPSDDYDEVLNLPTTANCLTMPNWEIGVIIPNFSFISSKDEKAFFEKVCPIDEKHVYETLYHCTYGVMASIIENDIDTFCASINNIQNCFWKSEERKLYGTKILEIEMELKSLGAKCIGMSSLGPALFFVANNTKEICKTLNGFFDNMTAISTNPTNKGRVIYYD